MRPTKRDELVQKALPIFYRNGFHATGMDKLAAETGISTTSMYKHFRTKEDLILASLRLRDELFRNWLMRRMEELADTPRGQLLALFDALGEWFEQDDFNSCMFIKAAGEYPAADHPIRASAAEHSPAMKERWLSTAPLGRPVEPDVYSIHTGSSGRARGGSEVCGCSRHATYSSSMQMTRVLDGKSACDSRGCSNSMLPKSVVAPEERNW